MVFNIFIYNIPCVYIYRLFSQAYVSHFYLLGGPRNNEHPQYPDLDSYKPFSMKGTMGSLEKQLIPGLAQVKAEPGTSCDGREQGTTQKMIRT